MESTTGVAAAYTSSPPWVTTKMQRPPPAVEFTTPVLKYPSRAPNVYVQAEEVLVAMATLIPLVE
jgi:hypothetical protein